MGRTPAAWCRPKLQSPRLASDALSYCIRSQTTCLPGRPSLTQVSEHLPGKPRCRWQLGRRFVAGQLTSQLAVADVCRGGSSCNSSSAPQWRHPVSLPLPLSRVALPPPIPSHARSRRCRGHHRAAGAEAGWLRPLACCAAQRGCATRAGVVITPPTLLAVRWGCQPFVRALSCCSTCSAALICALQLPASHNTCISVRHYCRSCKLTWRCTWNRGLCWRRRAGAWAPWPP